MQEQWRQHATAARFGLVVERPRDGGIVGGGNERDSGGGGDDGSGNGDVDLNVEGFEHGGWQEERCASGGGGGGWIS